MKRYKPVMQLGYSPAQDTVGMEESSDGEYLLRKDVESLIAALPRCFCGAIATKQGWKPGGLLASNSCDAHPYNMKNVSDLPYAETVRALGKEQA
jgi:hypothetical protein